MFIKRLHHNLKKRIRLYVAFVTLGSLIAITLTVFIYNRTLEPKIPTNLTVYEKEAYQKPLNITPEVVKQAKPIKLPILLYHYVENVKDPGDYIRKSLNVTPYNFEKQLQTLDDAGYTTYFARDVPKMLDGSIEVGDKNIILTFDDGYSDFYTDVFPLLKKYHVKATVFLITDFIGRKEFLKEKQIRELLGSGLVEIGSHTLHHVYLKKASVEVARKQIFDSRKQLEDQFGIQVTTFAYPYGVFTQKTLDLVKEASYSAAFSVIRGQVQSNENIFFLSRIKMGSTSGKAMLDMLQKLKN